MFRDEREAMAQKIDVMDREAEALRAQNEAMRQQLLAQQTQAPVAVIDPYRLGIEQLDPGFRAALSHHTLTPFPVWAMALLNLLSFGLFPLIYFGLCADKLPRAHPSDPNSGKAIGFAFIPYFNLYWVFFNSLRLADRLNLQLQLRGVPPMVPRGFAIATSIFSVIPYINIFIGWPIMWTIMVCFYQSAINRLAEMR